MPRFTFARAAAGLALCLTAGGLAALGSPAQAAASQATLVSGNPSCVSLGYDYGIKPSINGYQDVPGSYTDPSTGVTLTWDKALDKNGVVHSTVGAWTSSVAVDAFIVKGGNAANVYTYNPAQTGDDTANLVTPKNNSGKPAAISHIEACYYFKPSVAKTATTTFTRDWNWTIDKSYVGDGAAEDGSTGAITLAPGATYDAPYTVALTPTAVDRDWTVSGTITVTNPWNKAATATVEDLLPGAVVSCPSTTLAAKGSLDCTYTASVDSAADGVNTAKVTADYTGKDRVVTATAPYAFGDPTTVVDECVTVNDSQAGPLGDACAPGGKAFEYTIQVGPYTTPGTYTVPNTATFVAGSGENGSDNADVTVDVISTATGCTLTQGYWKNHPKHASWTSVGGPGATFLNSGETWQTVFDTSAKDYYYSLAHQYMAAKLNIANGASTTPEVEAALTQAESMLINARLKEGAVAVDSGTASPLVVTLTAFNEGKIGPGHCTK